MENMDASRTSGMPLGDASNADYENGGGTSREEFQELLKDFDQYYDHRGIEPNEMNAIDFDEFRKKRKRERELEREGAGYRGLREKLEDNGFEVFTPRQAGEDGRLEKMFGDRIVEAEILANFLDGVLKLEAPTRDVKFIKWLMDKKRIHHRKT